MSYQLTILDKIATLDDYNEGEQGMGNTFYVNETVKADTISGVIKKACDFVGGDFEGDEKCWNIDIDADQGRIDFQTMETADASVATQAELEQWKRGELDLYACYYVGYVEEIQPKSLESFARLEYLRGELRAERISQGELLELETLKDDIEPGDVELLEAAGVPESEA